MLAEKSWGGLWGDVLGADFANSNELLQLENEEVSGSSIHNVEEGIEWWANHELPSMIDPSLDSQDAPSDPVLPDVPADDNTIVCYGMVGDKYSTIIIDPLTLSFHH